MTRVALFLLRIIDFYEILILVWCVMSWIPLNPDGIASDIREAIGRLVRPYLDLFRRMIPPMAGIDFTPMIAIIVLQVLTNVILRIL
jgi:YggT family protein